MLLNLHLYQTSSRVQVARSTKDADDDGELYARNRHDGKCLHCRNLCDAALGEWNSDGIRVGGFIWEQTVQPIQNIIFSVESREIEMFASNPHINPQTFSLIVEL